MIHNLLRSSIESIFWSTQEWSNALCRNKIAIRVGRIQRSVQERSHLSSERERVKGACGIVDKYPMILSVHSHVSGNDSRTISAGLMTSSRLISAEEKKTSPTSWRKATTPPIAAIILNSVTIKLVMIGYIFWEFYCHFAVVRTTDVFIAMLRRKVVAFAAALLSSYSSCILKWTFILPIQNSQHLLAKYYLEHLAAN